MNDTPTRTFLPLADIRVLAVLASLLLSAFTILLPDSPNDDAWVYLRTAEIFLEQGVAAAFQHYPWAALSLLIGALNALGIPLFAAAWLLNALFHALLVYSLLSILRLLDGSRLVMGLAALCVLLYPQLNEYRYLVIRDLGFWALALFALWQFMCYREQHRLAHAGAFCAALILATAFRGEALVYLLLTPLVLLFDTRHPPHLRRRRFFQVSGLAAVSLVAVAPVLAMIGIDTSALFLAFFSNYVPFLDNLGGTAPATDNAELARLLFGEQASVYSREYLLLFVAVGLLAILAANLFAGIGGPFFWLLVWGWFRNHIRVDRNAVLPVVAWGLINLAIVLAFLYLTRYLTSRYGMLLCLLLSLAVPLVIARLVEGLRGRRHEQLGLRVLILFFGYCAFDSFVSFGDSKDFVPDSVAWLATHDRQDTGLITNNQAIAYYSGKVEDYDEAPRFISGADIIGAGADDWIVLELHDEMRELLASDAIGPLVELQAVFPEVGEQRVAIYRRLAP